MMQRSVFAFYAALCIGVTQSFVPHPRILTNAGTQLSMAEDGTEDERISMEPCWQSLLDDDCFMSQMYASNFVAGKWIKSLPCGEGIEVSPNTHSEVRSLTSSFPFKDCDMPAALMTPEIFPDSGVNAVDVMSFLDLKRSPTFSSNDK